MSRESLLVFSDVHLGSDLNDRGVSPRRSQRIDQDLVVFLRHYGATKPTGDRWRVVIAGDFIDFIGMAVTPSEGEPIVTALTAEEHAHGLGNASDHAVAKLRRVAARHGDVFDALGDLLARGHALTLVHGNHDVDFHWDDVKDLFREIVTQRATASSFAPADLASPSASLRSGLTAADITARISFEPWFFYLHNVAYIEHGHMYDPFCAVDHVMAPLSPFDPRRVTRGFSHILLRYVVRQTRGMKEHGHETMNALDYLTFAVKLGFRGLVAVGMRFARAVVELFRLRTEHFSLAAATLRTEHERRMQLLAEATRLGIEKLRALAHLQAPPLTRSISGILASVLLDRLALGAGSAILCIVSAFLGFRHGHFWLAGGLILVAWVLVHRWLARRRQVDPAERMVLRAAEVARLLPAAFVVMGHTHAPESRAVSPNTTYINLGSWAEEEDEPEAPHYRAARTHLVIEHQSDGELRAELREWSPDGPRKYRGPSIHPPLE